ncbi:MAG: RnfABCDGE type electron transport complex subunit B [Oscillospiraceae bacterium]|nr:RnfABCDGE type electron transport complex subunit B [Oscillospiraceae bacterium]
MNPILSAVLVVTVIGVIGAIVLVAASVVMHVPVDERVEQINAVLAGVNCGACGYAGCSDYARAVVEGGAPVDKCTPGGSACAAAVAAIMGVEAGETGCVKAVVACSGDCEHTPKRFEYQGLSRCAAVKGLYGGDGACTHGCLGYGDCAAVCPFGAIAVERGIARVDRSKCVGCGLCVGACPNDVIRLVPEHRRKPVVLCSSKDKGADTRKVCSAGCIGCMKCTKVCAKDAIVMDGSLAVIDQTRCVGCQLCLKECPVGIIRIPGVD